MLSIRFGLFGLALACAAPCEAAAHARAGFDADAVPNACGLCGADCALDPAGEGVVVRYRAPADILDIVEMTSMLLDLDFDYLLRAAALESSFDPATEAKTSSATGLYQFVEQTWFHLLAEVGPAFGLDDLSGAIRAGEDGYEVADAALRAEILRLRYDPHLSALLAGVFTQRNAAFLAQALGRTPEADELYVAHVMGAAGAAELIRLAAEEPDARANKPFGRAARANRTIFFDGKRPRSAAEVLEILKTKYRNVPVYATEPARRPAPPAWTPPPVLPLDSDEPDLSRRRG